MPAFKLHGMLVYLRDIKPTYWFYPTASGIAAFKDELSKVQKTQKGSVQFPLDKPMPITLIKNGKV